MESSINELEKRIKKGGEQKYHDQLKKDGKLFARDRIGRLCDKQSFVEDGLYANCEREGFAADGVVTGLGRIGGRQVAVVANDATVKAGSWGERTVEKIIRIQEMAAHLGIPIFYLVDSAGIRLTEQMEVFAGRRGAGRIFYNEAVYSGKAPQICLLFGPSAAGGAYMPAFCDIIILVDKNASMYLGSPRVAEAVIGEKVSLEDMGGARLHCEVSGLGDVLVSSEEQAIEMGKQYFSFMPLNDALPTAVLKSKEPRISGRELESLIPKKVTSCYDMNEVIQAIVDEGSFFELKELYAREILTGLARIDGKAVGIVANQTLVKGGVLFVESSLKAARFVELCDRYRIPLLFLTDVSGFMVGSQVEKKGILRAGARMIYSVSRATVPKVCLVVRKAHGAGLYAMAGPAFGSDCVLALPSAQVAVMGFEPAMNAVYFNKLAAMSNEEKESFREEQQKQYKEEANIRHVANELVVDHIVPFSDVRTEVVKRFDYYRLSQRNRMEAGLMPM